MWRRQGSVSLRAVQHQGFISDLVEYLLSGMDVNDDRLIDLGDLFMRTKDTNNGNASNLSDGTTKEPLTTTPTLPLPPELLQ